MPIEELYREKILQHYRDPHHFGLSATPAVVPATELPSSDKISPQWIRVNRDNPLCGDQVCLVLQVSDANYLQDIRFQGAGCAFCISSASMMCDVVINKCMAEVESITYDVLLALHQEGDSEVLDRYGDVAAFKSVIPFPNRIECVILAWQALQDAIQQLRQHE